MAILRTFTDADEFIQGAAFWQQILINGVLTWALVVDDEIYAEGGNDTVFAGNGDDTVEGGLGHDVIHGEGGQNDLSGGEGNDQLFGGNGGVNAGPVAGQGDRLDGGLGNDYIRGGSSGDIIWGGLGNDYIYGGDGNDLIQAGLLSGSVPVGESDRDTVWGGAGNDSIITGRTGGNYYGDDGNDSITALKDSAGVSMSGDDGDDTLQGGGGDDHLFGGNDNDVLNLSDGQDVVAGGSGDDLFQYYADPAWQLNYKLQFLDGGAGYDTYSFASAETGIDVAASYAWTSGGVANIEKIVGGKGNDTIRDLTGVDYVSANIGDDTVHASTTTSQTLIGGGDVDTLVFKASSGTGVTLYTDAALAQNALVGNGTSHKVREFEIYELTDQSDSVYGAGADEEVTLGKGADIAFGGGGDDTLRGDAGEDVLNGGTGDDLLAGGNEADTFHFDINSEFGHDLILDFEAQDQIVLDTNGAAVGQVQLDEQDGDLLISVLGLPKSSILVLGGAERVSEENLLIEEGFELLDLGGFLF